MLQIVIPGTSGEYWDEKKEEFVYAPKKEVTLKLEHSLISISKWESKWCVPFLDTNKTDEQALDYIKCMSLNNDVTDELIGRMTRENIQAINDYISAPMTATTVRSIDKGRNNMRITSELVYYWMIAYNIPQAYEKWHFNRLIMLIRVCAEMNKPKNGKKVNTKQLGAYYKELNAQRKAAWHTTG